MELSCNSSSAAGGERSELVRSTNRGAASRSAFGVSVSVSNSSRRAGRRILIHLAVILPASIGPLSASAADGVALYAGPERSGGFALFAPRLAEALGGKRELETRPTRSALESLEFVLSDPDAIAFAQFDNYRRFLDDPERKGAPLEFYGDVPFCVLAATRANGPWALSPDELPGDLVPEAIDIGSSGGDVANSLAAIVATAPKLEGVKIENRGGARALSRLRQRALDVMFLIEYPHRRSPLVGDILDADDITFVPSPAIFFAGAASDVKGAFIPTRIVVPGSSWFAPSEEINTICTPFGVVVNGGGDPDTLDFVVSAATDGALLGDQEGFWTALGNIVSRTWSSVVNTVSSWLP